MDRNRNSGTVFPVFLRSTSARVCGVAMHGTCLLISPTRALYSFHKSHQHLLKIVLTHKWCCHPLYPSPPTPMWVVMGTRVTASFASYHHKFVLFEESSCCSAALSCSLFSSFFSSSAVQCFRLHHHGVYASSYILLWRKAKKKKITTSLIQSSSHCTV